MDYIIQLIGIILVFHPFGSAGPATALIPTSTKLDFCASSHPPKVVTERHRAFFRIQTTRIANKSGWPPAEITDCIPSEHCKLFEIPVASDITIDSGFPTAANNKEGTTFCLVPRLEEVKPGVRLMPSARTSSLITWDLPGGTLEAHDLGTGAIATQLRVVAPPGTPLNDITITATPRGGGSPRVLMVAAGTEVNLVSMPATDAGTDLAAVHHVPEVNAHFYLYNNLLNPADELCSTPIPSRTTCDAVQVAHPGVNHDAFCSNTGCCP